MLLRQRCRNCNTPYDAQTKGKMAVLCRNCALECDEAFNVVHRYLLRRLRLSQSAPFNLNELTQDTGIPEIYIWLMAREGRFGDKLLFENNEHRCKQCYVQLKGSSDREHCSECSKSINQRLKNALENLTPTLRRQMRDQQQLARRTKDKTHLLGL